MLYVFIVVLSGSFFAFYCYTLVFIGRQGNHSSRPISMAKVRKISEMAKLLGHKMPMLQKIVGLLVISLQSNQLTRILSHIP